MEEDKERKGHGNLGKDSDRTQTEKTPRCTLGRSPFAPAGCLSTANPVARYHKYKPPGASNVRGRWPAQSVSKHSYPDVCLDTDVTPPLFPPPPPAKGATTLNVPDTVGYTTPSEFKALIRGLRAHVKGVEGVTISVHGCVLVAFLLFSLGQPPAWCHHSPHLSAPSSPPS